MVSLRITLRTDAFYLEYRQQWCSYRASFSTQRQLIASYNNLDKNNLKNEINVGKDLLFVMGWLCTVKIHILKTWSPVLQNVTLFGEEVFTAVIKLKCGHWSSPNSIWLVSL